MRYHGLYGPHLPHLAVFCSSDMRQKQVCQGLDVAGLKVPLTFGKPSLCRELQGKQKSPSNHKETTANRAEIQWLPQTEPSSLTYMSFHYKQATICRTLLPEALPLAAYAPEKEDVALCQPFFHFLVPVDPKLLKVVVDLQAPPESKGSHAFVTSFQARQKEMTVTPACRRKQVSFNPFMHYSMWGQMVEKP